MMRSAISLESESWPSLSLIKSISDSGEYLICIGITSLEVSLFRRSVNCNYKGDFIPVFIDGSYDFRVFNSMRNESFTVPSDYLIWKEQCIDNFAFFKVPEFNSFNSVWSKFNCQFFTFYLNFEANVKSFFYYGDDSVFTHRHSLYYSCSNIKDFNGLMKIVNIETSTEVKWNVSQAEEGTCPPSQSITYETMSVKEFSGLIDDVRIYNYARTVEQILQDYNAGAAARLGE